MTTARTRAGTLRIAPATFNRPMSCGLVQRGPLALVLAHRERRQADVKRVPYSGLTSRSAGVTKWLTLAEGSNPHEAAVAIESTCRGGPRFHIPCADGRRHAASADWDQRGSRVRGWAIAIGRSNRYIWD
jgi:hypothetical protein